MQTNLTTGRKKTVTLLSIVFLIFLAGILLTPWITGYVVQRKVDQFITALNHQENTKISQVKYQRGWLSSEIHFSFTQNALLKALQPNEENTDNLGRYVIHIAHGPVVYDVMQHRWRFALAALRIALYLPDTSHIIMMIKNPIEINGILTTKQLNSHFTLTANDTLRNLKWEGIKGTSTITHHGAHTDQFTIQVNSQSSPIKYYYHNKFSPWITLSIAPITINSQFNLSASDRYGFSNSNAQIILPLINIESSVESTEINNIFIVIQHALHKKDLVDFFTQITFDKMSTTKFLLNKTLLNYSVKNFYAPSLFKLNGMLKKYQDPNISATDQAILRTQLPEIINSMLPANASAETTLNMMTKHGNLQTTTTLKWQGKPFNNKEINNDFFAENIISTTRLNLSSDMMEFLFKDRFVLNVIKQKNIPITSKNDYEIIKNELNDTFQRYLNETVKLGFLQKNQQGYTTTFTYQDGTLKMNDKKIKFESLNNFPQIGSSLTLPSSFKTPDITDFDLKSRPADKN